MRRPRLHIHGRMLLAFLALAVLVLAIAKFASEVAEGDTMAFDRAVLLGLRSGHPGVPVGPAWLGNAMVQLTALGSGTVLWLLTAMAAGYLLTARKPASAGFLLLSVGAGMALNTLLKDVFVRPRPELVAHLVHVQTTSFPSGHAMNSAIVYLTIGGMLAQAEPKRPLRIYLLAMTILVTVLVGLSRVYLGVHWPSDVLAGWCVGSLWAIICLLAAEMARRAFGGGQEPDRPRLDRPGSTTL
jgi:undecaprenyl-diphosphatase